MKDAHQKMCVGPKKHPRDPATQEHRSNDSEHRSNDSEHRSNDSEHP